MRRSIVIFGILIVLIAMPDSTFAQTPRKTMSHSAWVAKSLSAIQTIKVGMSRGDLLKLFTVEGGVSNRRMRTYVFRECPYIKVDVGFEPIGAPEDKWKGRSEDKITRLSKPYLEQSVID